MPLQIPANELNNLDSYRKLDEIGICINKQVRVSRELLERIKCLKENATFVKQKSFQFVSGLPRMACNPIIDEEARGAYFDFEQAIILDFWVERVREEGLLTAKTIAIRPDPRGTSGRTHVFKT